MRICVHCKVNEVADTAYYPICTQCQHNRMNKSWETRRLKPKPLTKICTKCGIEKSVTEFYSSQGHLYPSCIECCKKKRLKPAYLVREQKCFAATKIEVLAHYGKDSKPVCVICGESRVSCLTIDHINGGGTKHRETVTGGIRFYYWLKRNNYPEGYQTLCMTDNFLKLMQKENHIRIKYETPDQDRKERIHQVPTCTCCGINEVTSTTRYCHQCRSEATKESWEIRRGKPRSATKRCTKCHVIKPLSEFYSLHCRDEHPYTICAECCKAKQKEPDNRKRQQERFTETKLEVLSHYGKNSKPTCVVCGENRIQGLTIDHINGGGVKHRKLVTGGSGGSRFYSWLKRSNYPEGYQTLCMNCQFVKRVRNSEYRHKT